MTQQEAGGDDVKEGETPDSSRRDFLKVAATLSAALAVVGIASVTKSLVIPSVPGGTQPTQSFPRVKVTSISSLTNDSVVIFNYPLDDEPNLLVKTGVASKGGVGPGGDVVAFSQICQHLGCIYGYVPKGSSPNCDASYVADFPAGYCCCHGSVYDLTNGANVVAGPTPRPQPQVLLEVDSAGDIYAVGMGPPTVFGHNTGSSDVTEDLKGGNPV